MFSLLARRDFRLLWVAHSVSILGDYVFFIAMTFWVYARTGSSSAVGAILITSGLPFTLIAPLAGRVVDRWRKTTIMAIAEASRAILFLSLLAILLIQPRSLLPIYVVGSLQSFIAAFFWAARGAILPDLVDNASLEGANALYQFSDGIVRVGAPSLAAFILLIFSAAGVTAFDAATFLISASCLALLASTPLSLDKRAFPRRSLTPAPNHVAHSGNDTAASAARVVYTLGALITYVLGTFSVLLPIFAKSLSSTSPLLYGAMVTAQAFGEVGISLLLGRSAARQVTKKALVGYFAMDGLALMALAFAHMAPLALILNLCVGIAFGAITIALLTRLQRLAPASRLGRRMATLTAVQSFAQLSGIGLASLSASSIGAVRLLILDGLLYMGAACWIGVARGTKDEA